MYVTCVEAELAAQRGEALRCVCVCVVGDVTAEALLFIMLMLTLQAMLLLAAVVIGVLILSGNKYIKTPTLIYFSF